MGILNLGCDVRPPKIMENTTLDVIVTMVIIPLDMVVASNAQYKYILLVSPKPSTKKTLFVLKFIQSKIVK